MPPFLQATLHAVVVRSTQDTKCAAAAKSSTEISARAAVIEATTRGTTCAVARGFYVLRGSGRAVAFTSTTAAVEAAAVESLSDDGKSVAMINCAKRICVKQMMDM